MSYLFTYGSLILDSSKIQLKPRESVFIRGYKIIIKKSPITQTNYHNLCLLKTDNSEDIVAGYLAEVDQKILQDLDNYEGSNYQRIEASVFNRRLEEVKAFVYIAI